jgi:hypothetical protein
MAVGIDNRMVQASAYLLRFRSPSCFHWLSPFYGPNVHSNGVKSGFTKGVLVIRPNWVQHPLADANCSRTTPFEANVKVWADAGGVGQRGSRAA